MREFFRGWRRKFGVVTLVMACVLTAGWLRSGENFDFVSIPFIDGSYGIMSADHRVKMTRSESTFDASWTSGDLSQLGMVYNMEGIRSRWNPFRDAYVHQRWDWGEVSLATSQLKIPPNTNFQCCVIPYWPITVGLTLISAYLLISKQHKTTPKKISEPIPAARP